MTKNRKNQEEDGIGEDKLEHAKSGFRVIIDHTDQLLKDSDLLIKKKRYSASVPLSVLAIEELGKAIFISTSIRLQKP